MRPTGSHRAGEVIFGVVALVGPGLIAAAITGTTLSAVVLVAMPIVVMGWTTYYWFVVRPNPIAVKPRDRSTEHEPEI